MPIPQLNGHGALPAYSAQPCQVTSVELVRRCDTTPEPSGRNTMTRLYFMAGSGDGAEWT